MTSETFAGEARHALRFDHQQPAARSELDAVLDRLPAYTVDVGGRRYVVKRLRKVEQWDALERALESLAE